MDLRTQISRYPGTPEDRLLLSHTLDLLEQGARKGRMTSTDFLSPAEQALIRQQLSVLHPVFYGGHPDTERRICLYLPDYLSEEDLSSISPITAFRAEFSPRETLSHRDFLGALMGCGIERSCIGDLFVREGFCDFFLTKAISPYVRQNLLSAGRIPVSVSEIPIPEVVVPEKKSRTVQDTVASLRLDSICSTAFRMSREKASTAIRAGKVSVNSLPCEKPDRLIREGDAVSLRGSGKAVLEQVGGNTRKGRISITIQVLL
ncbi:MAG: RNA-binding protein [Oscillospiraceae bacterium]|nr:RNA-binding protein [Oscillospiraceae bacterium]